MTNLDKRYLSIHPEVAQALLDKKPIVALESTVISHGLPFPENRELAQSLEAVIREKGCTPATIAILDGIIHIGLDHRQVEQLAQSEGMVKISSRDIAPAIERQQSGGTTVAGTLVIAHLTGIKVFATGGIGGVHRQAPFDVSADLMQLASTPIAVICAGAKAILDIPATLELLETYGVPVIGYGCDEFPAFYSKSSGMKVSARVDLPEEAAGIAKTHWGLGLSSAILVTVPPPVEVALENVVVETAVQTALNEAQHNHIYGQAVTPFLLSRVSQLTGGESLRANLALLRNNARVAADIARFI